MCDKDKTLEGTEPRRILWLDGLKGLACMLVFWGHLYLVYAQKSTVALEQMNPGLFSFFNIANILVNGNLGVCLFCMISGYFAGKKKIESVRELGKIIVLRYLKFVAVFFFMAIVIAVLDMVGGFQTRQWGVEFGNIWITGFYNAEYSFWNYLKFVFLFDSVLNMPLWTIAPIFLGNVLIYVMNFLFRKSSEWMKVVLSLLFVLLGMVCGYPGYSNREMAVLYTGVGFLGILLPYAWKYLEKWKDWLLAVLLVCAVIGVSGGYRYVVSYASMVVYVPEFFYSVVYWNLALSIVMLALLGGMKCLHGLLQGSFLLGLNKLSFPLYLMHWPLLCSAGLLMHGFLHGLLGNTLAFLLSVLMMHLLTVGLSMVYNRTWHKWSERILGKLIR